MGFLLLNLICTVHLFATLCSGAHFIDLPAFDGEVPVQPPNRRSLGYYKSDDSWISDEEQRISELDMPNSNETISTDMLGYKDHAPKPLLEVSSIETYNNFMSENSDSEDPDPEDQLTTHSPARRRMINKYDEASDKLETETSDSRRHWLVSESPPIGSPSYRPVSEEKDANLKTKILTLVQQTMHDTDLKVRGIQSIKDKYRDKSSYRIGFILSMVKKSRDVLNELFNVAVKHREEWKALEQLKIFELIVHTNVDTTNLVRQLVELHINNLNATQNRIRFRAGRTTQKARFMVL